MFLELRSWAITTKRMHTENVDFEDRAILVQAWMQAIFSRVAKGNIERQKSFSLALNKIGATPVLSEYKSSHSSLAAFLMAFHKLNHNRTSFNLSSPASATQFYLTRSTLYSVLHPIKSTCCLHY